jgi:hypothetical protein
MYNQYFKAIMASFYILKHTFAVTSIGLSINRPTKLGREKSPADGYCQCKKEMDDHILASQQIFEKVPHSYTPRKRVSIIFKN